MSRVYNDHMVFNHILRSNIPKQEKSGIRKWFDSITGGKMSEVIEHYGLNEPVPEEKQITLFQAAVGGAEGLGTGAALGALHALLDDGLDFKVPLTDKRVPIDAAVSSVSLLGAVFSPIGKEHLKNAGVSAAGVYGFRKFHDMLAAKRAISKIHGEEAPATSADLKDEEPAPADIGEDPIVTLANNLKE